MKMIEILDKYSDCDTFCLTGGINDYDCDDEIIEQEIDNLKYDERDNFINKHLIKYKITEEDYMNAFKNVKEKLNDRLRLYYEENKDKLNIDKEYNELYSDIEKECFEYCRKRNKKRFIKSFFSKDVINNFKSNGISDNEINRIKNDFFHCSFIVDNVGKTTKYGKDNHNFFWHFYHTIGLIIDYQNDKEKFCCNNGVDPVNQIPEELKNCLLYYEISFYNSVTMSNNLMINYYFLLNDNSKKYLSKYESDFDLDKLEDLTLFKNKEEMFYSCTHEEFNSLES